MEWHALIKAHEPGHPTRWGRRLSKGQQGSHVPNPTQHMSGQHPANQPTNGNRHRMHTRHLRALSRVAGGCCVLRALPETRSVGRQKRRPSRAWQNKQPLSQYLSQHRSTTHPGYPVHCAASARGAEARGRCRSSKAAGSRCKPLKYTQVLGSHTRMLASEVRISVTHGRTPKGKKSYNMYHVSGCRRAQAQRS